MNVRTRRNCRRGSGLRRSMRRWRFTRDALDCNKDKPILTYATWPLGAVTSFTGEVSSRSPERACTPLAGQIHPATRAVRGGRVVLGGKLR